MSVFQMLALLNLLKRLNPSEYSIYPDAKTGLDDD